MTSTITDPPRLTPGRARHEARQARRHGYRLPQRHPYRVLPTWVPFGIASLLARFLP